MSSTENAFSSHPPPAIIFAKACLSMLAAPCAPVTMQVSARRVTAMSTSLSTIVCQNRVSSSVFSAPASILKLLTVVGLAH